MRLKVDIIGLILIAIGLIMLFNYLGYTDIRVMDILFSYWPLILIYIGIKMLFDRSSKSEIIIGALLCFLGLGLLGDNLNVFRFDIGYFIGLIWPIAMILIGLSLMYNPKQKKKGSDYSKESYKGDIPENDTILNTKTENLDSYNKVNKSPKIKVNLTKDSDYDGDYETESSFKEIHTVLYDSFEELWDIKDGSYTAFMGGVELDISKAKFLKEEVNINLTAVMGGIEILVPRDVTIHCKGTAVLGGLEFIGKESGGVFSNLTGDYIPQIKSKGTIFFNCNVLMGEITINFK
ncbi:putative membrane protein [Acetoanaerobium pronyense]|uniref:Membrane protein n=1 Tax=Acetoanaerobium pronyense TaxID=1482736 RepID=A0ABS4KEX8_9FIRM|nr:LiaF domain-containing protein [Acetoanaerobium pronyense]MBP2026328.1 putative membrane protein [Acetoanaerobium pronyense]